MNLIASAISLSLYILIFSAWTLGRLVYYLAWTCLAREVAIPLLAFLARWSIIAGVATAAFAAWVALRLIAALAPRRVKPAVWNVINIITGDAVRQREARRQHMIEAVKAHEREPWRRGLPESAPLWQELFLKDAYLRETEDDWSERWGA